MGHFVPIARPRFGHAALALASTLGIRARRRRARCVPRGAALSYFSLRRVRRHVPARADRRARYKRCRASRLARRLASASERERRRSASSWVSPAAGSHCSHDRQAAHDTVMGGRRDVAGRQHAVAGRMRLTRGCWAIGTPCAGRILAYPGPAGSSISSTWLAADPQSSDVPGEVNEARDRRRRRRRPRRAARRGERSAALSSEPKAALAAASPVPGIPMRRSCTPRPGARGRPAAAPEARHSRSSCGMDRALCYDPASGRIVYKPARALMPDIPGLQRENISVKRDRIVLRYSF